MTVYGLRSTVYSLRGGYLKAEGTEELLRDVHP